MHTSNYSDNLIENSSSIASVKDKKKNQIKSKKSQDN